MRRLRGTFLANEKVCPADHNRCRMHFAQQKCILQNNRPNTMGYPPLPRVLLYSISPSHPPVRGQAAVPSLECYIISPGRSAITPKISRPSRVGGRAVAEPRSRHVRGERRFRPLVDDRGGYQIDCCLAGREDPLLHVRGIRRLTRCPLSRPRRWNGGWRPRGYCRSHGRASTVQPFHIPSCRDVH